MKNISVETLLHCLFLEGKWELQEFAAEKLKNHGNNDIFSKIIEIAKRAAAPELLEDLRNTLKQFYGEYVVEELFRLIKTRDTEQYEQMVEAFKQSYKDNIHTELPLKISWLIRRKYTLAESITRLPIKSIMELHHSGNKMGEKFAKECILDSYGNFVRDIIRKYYPTYVNDNYQDMFQCGCIGLLSAMKSYDCERGAFTTFSISFIRHEINAWINYFSNDSTVHYTKLQNRINEAVRELEAEGIQPTVPKISILTDLKPEIVQRELKFMERTKFVYLDDPVEGEAQEPSMGYTESPEHVMLNKEKNEALLSALKGLPEEIREILVRRFDLEQTIDTIAKCTSETFGRDISIGQVKNYIQKGLSMLRSNMLLKTEYPERISRQERDVLRYMVIQSPPTKKDIDQEIDDLIDIMEML